MNRHFSKDVEKASEQGGDPELTHEADANHSLRESPLHLLGWPYRKEKASGEAQDVEKRDSFCRGKA